MSSIWPIFKREFAAYFATPLAYVFIVIFLFAMGAFTFYIGHFYENGVADLSVFFGFHPWLYLFLVPAISMRLWAEERRTGTMELLLTLPVPLWATVAGKFLAAWVFAGLAHVLSEMPSDYPSRPKYVAQFKEMAGEIASLQGPDGLWRPGLLDAADYPLPEVSGSAFFTYGFAWGMNNGLLDRKK